VGSVIEQSEHLSNAQIENYGIRTSGAGPDAAQPDEALRINAHLESCPSCRRRLLDFHRASFGLLADPQQLADVQVRTVPTPECPSDDDLRQLAAGLSSTAPITDTVAAGDALATRLLQHAATCDHCGPLLRTFTEDFSDDFTTEEQATVANLQSSSEAWQKNTARQMLEAAATRAAGNTNAVVARRTEVGSSRTAATVKSHQKSSTSGPASSAPARKPFFWKWVLAPATAGVLASIVFGVLYSQRDTPEKVEQYLAKAYTEKRPMEMRWPGAEWGPPQMTLGSSESVFSKPGPLIDAEKIIKDHSASSSGDSKWLRARAEAEILDGNPQFAIQFCCTGRSRFSSLDAGSGFDIFRTISTFSRP
jgi:hypothetical protein